MNESTPFFWMNGILATDLVEITHDFDRLEDGGFWAVSISFEGEPIFARFAKVQRDHAFPKTSPWKTLETTWRSSLEQEAFYRYVDEIRSQISKGVVYQANACRVLTTEIAPEISLDALFEQLLQQNNAPHASFLRIPELEIASASPELFLQRNGQFVKTSPIKGTQDPQHKSSFGLKDQSENIMIVDLMRNDLGRICEIGSVSVTDFLRAEEHPGVRHLVSDVSGKLRADVGWEEIFVALLPPGSVSGTPKSSALKVIRQNEPSRRDIYCGVLGWVEGDHCSLSVAIRTFWKRGQTLSFGTGGGITWPSEPDAEWRETQLKANRLIGIAGGIDSEGWQFGSGIFETILLDEGRPLLFSKHMERAEKSGGELSIEIPSRASILKAIKELSPPSLARLRLSFGRNFSLAMFPYELSLEPLRVGLRENQAKSGFGGHKKFPYWENFDLLRTANLEGFDEVLLADSRGVLGEGAMNNFLFKIGGVWVTPKLSSGVLPGVVRAVALEKGIATEKELKVEDLQAVDAMLALSSLRICTPVSLLGTKELQIDQDFDLLFNILWDAAQSDSVG